VGHAHRHTQAHGAGKYNAIRQWRQTENIEIGLRMPPERTGLKIHAILESRPALESFLEES
jgi:hypothetical protein